MGDWCVPRAIETHQTCPGQFAGEGTDRSTEADRTPTGFPCKFVCSVHIRDVEKIAAEAADTRTSEQDIEPLLVNRWSPRAMTGESLSDDQYLPLFEAARWAPSSYNNQHWRFLYATREDEEFEQFADLLSEGNRVWAEDAAVLVTLVSKQTFDHNDEPARTHSFDTGAAWQNLALEATRRNLVAHAMQGFDYEAAAEQLGVPDEFAVECMIAVGDRAPAATLPDDLQEREFPNGRKPIGEILHQGGFAD